MKAKLPPNVTVTRCIESGKDIYYTEESGRRRSLCSWGKCRECGYEYAEEELRTSVGSERTSYPVIHEGLMCQNCWDNWEEDDDDTGRDS